MDWAYLIIGMFCFVSSIVMLLVFTWEETKVAFWVFVALILGGVLCCIFGSLEGKRRQHEASYADGYEQGQVDAAAGIQSYERVYMFFENDTIPYDTVYVKIEE